MSASVSTMTTSGTITDNDDNDNSIAYAYFIKVSFVVKVCEKLHIKIDWNVLLPILSAIEMPIIITLFFSLSFSFSLLLFVSSVWVEIVCYSLLLSTCILCECVFLLLRLHHRSLSYMSCQRFNDNR